MTTRTPSQNSAIHLYFRMVAEALNDAGKDMETVLQLKTIDVPWNEAMVKEVLWKAVQRSMEKGEHTSDLETTDITEIYETLNRWMGAKLGVSVEFPHNEERP